MYLEQANNKKHFWFGNGKGLLGRNNQTQHWMDPTKWSPDNREGYPIMYPSRELPPLPHQNSLTQSSLSKCGPSGSKVLWQVHHIRPTSRHMSLTCSLCDTARIPSNPRAHPLEPTKAHKAKIRLDMLCTHACSGYYWAVDMYCRYYQYKWCPQAG